MIARIRSLVDRILWAMFPYWERLGVHVLPVHFYSPIPDTRFLLRHRHRLEMEHSLPGVELRAEEQIALLQTVITGYEREYREADPGRFGIDHSTMPSFAPFNALVLYAFIRHFRPHRIIEVGSGLSTYISARAVLRNREDGTEGRLTVIDPYPGSVLRSTLVGEVELIAEPVENVPLERFTSLRTGDILFIDSTHTVKPLGDVPYLYLTILPQLAPGVLVHVHDIFLPYEYLPHHFLNRGARQFWQEQYLVHAFLVYNSRFEVLLSTSYLHGKQRELLHGLFPWYHANRWPSSFWMRSVERPREDPSHP